MNNLIIVSICSIILFILLFINPVSGSVISFVLATIGIYFIISVVKVWRRVKDNDRNSNNINDSKTNL